MKVKSIVRNYLTGKEYVAIKNKEDLPIKGYANVYLYNARTGKLEVEAHTPNLIMPEIYAWLKSYQWDKFCTGAFNKTNSYGGYWEMDNIYLTDSNRPETERINRFNYATSPPIWGNLIGWANKSTYSGSDTQRGSPNSSESYANDTRIHWVFDWPTHAANGTFQTIIWANTLDIQRIGWQKNIGITSGGDYAGGLAYDGTYLYLLKSNAELYKLTTDGSIISQVTAAVGGTNLACDGTYLYTLGGGKLYKLTTAGQLVSEVSVTLSSISGITSDGTYIYVLQNAHSGVISKLSTSGSIISQKSTGIYAGGFPTPLMYDGTYLYASTLQTLWMLDMDMNIIKTLLVGISKYGAYLGGVYAADKFYLFHFQGTLYAYTLQDHYFARTLLASPVTKTSTQTMKIQYDFVYG